MIHFIHLSWCTCTLCTRTRIEAQERKRQDERFRDVMAEVQRLREARAALIERRDRGEWDAFRRFCCITTKD